MENQLRYCQTTYRKTRIRWKLASDGKTKAPHSLKINMCEGTNGLKVGILKIGRLVEGRDVTSGILQKGTIDVWGMGMEVVIWLIDGKEVVFLTPLDTLKYVGIGPPILNEPLMPDIMWGLLKNEKTITAIRSTHLDE